LKISQNWWEWETGEGSGIAGRGCGVCETFSGWAKIVFIASVPKKKQEFPIGFAEGGNGCAAIVYQVLLVGNM
jgi:hypothetical protein